MPEISRGAHVTHPHYGSGVVKALRHRGFEVLVSFSRFQLWVPARELTVVTQGLRLVTPVETDASKPSEPPARRSVTFEDILKLLHRSAQKDQVPKPSKDRSPAATLPPPTVRPLPSGGSRTDAVDIEALRLGIVPLARIGSWTVGREMEAARMRQFLLDDSEGAITIEGAYGAGKTHLLAYLAEQAARAGFAVAMAGFDPSEAAAAFPKRAYRRLVRGFLAPVEGRRLDFRGFLRTLAEKDPKVLSDHWAFGPFLDLLRRGRVEEQDWAWIEGRNGGARASFPTLHDHSTCANLYCSLLSALSRAGAEVLGLRGLVVLLDEAEVAKSVLYSYHFVRGLNFFRGLILTANDDPVLIEEKVVRGDFYSYGAETGLLYSGHRPVRYTTGIPSLLKVAFALTPGTLRQELKQYRDTMDFVPLDPLPPADLRRLFGLICDRFAAVYGVRLTTREREDVYRLVSQDSRVGSTREFIKGAVEALDGLRFYPAVPLAEVLAAGTAS